MLKALVAVLVLASGTLAFNVPIASAQRGECLSSSSGLDLVMNGDGFDVTATTALTVPADAVVTAELHKVTQGAPEEIVVTGTAMTADNIAAFSTWIPRDSLGKSGDVVSLYGYFNVPGGPTARTCGILNIHL